MQFKKNISLVIGISIPLLMIIFVGLSIYLPGIFIKPKTNFIYYVGDSYYSNSYSVSSSHLVEIPSNYTGNLKTFPQTNKIYLYNVQKEDNTELSYSEAQKLFLDSNVTSPDGFEVKAGGSGGFFPFFGSYDGYYQKYLVGHNVSKKLKLLSGNQYGNTFHFLGWVKN